GGIVLGDHAIPVESALKQAFIQTGLIHLLAASGFNVGIVAGFILWLGQLIFTRGPFRNPMARVMGLTGSSWQILLAMISVAGYCLLTGLPPSIQRSGMMLELALILKLFDKALSPVLLLGVAVSLILIASPDVIGNIGFQFSVLTTFGLITMVSPLQEWLGYYITRWLSGIILIPIIAQLWITPLSIYYFNQLPLHSVLLNCLSLVFISPLTLIGFVSALLSFIWAPLGEWGAWCAQPFLNGMLYLVHWGADMEWAQMSPESPEIWIIVGAYLLLLIASASFYLYTEAPKSRRILGVAVPTFIFCLALIGQKVLVNQNTSLQAVPVSYHQLAWVARPRGSNQFLLLLPQSLSFWESRTLKDYIKHLNPQQLAGIIVLPTADETVKIKYPVGESYFLKFLAKSFPHQLISVYSPSSFDVFSGHPTHSEYQSHFKTVGLNLRQTLRYGTLAFQWTDSNEFQLNTPTYCLTNQDKSSHCRLQYQQPPSGPYRLRFKQYSNKLLSKETSQKKSWILNNNQFYDFESDSEKLNIY
ncbi:MAG: ComEC/Rec2 family competence protein, partial [Cyanobacteria bacterium]|nr:ComEC/Rec2 family competence protein [Cyanobacteriota bacterium]